MFMMQKKIRQNLGIKTNFSSLFKGEIKDTRTLHTSVINEEAQEHAKNVSYQQIKCR